MKLIIHDLTPEQEIEVLLPKQDTCVISDDGSIKPCIGCFGCWIKTPGQCVIRDNYGNMGETLSKCDELILISRCTYGGFSPFVKNVLDRSISYIHPFFIIKNGEMHHRLRYNRHLNMSVYFYSSGLTEQDRTIAKSLVKANAINLHGIVTEVLFEENAKAFGGRIK
ncbi:MAG: flavodoxin family protein [Clostridia bacterium]|jgi:multimeric flavodoxin WrbA